MGLEFVLFSLARQVRACLVLVRHKPLQARRTAPADHGVMKLIRQGKDVLPQVRCPSLIIYSTADPDIHPDAAQFTYDHIGVEDKKLVTLHNCGHCITVDAEWEAVAEKTCQFIADHV